MPSIRLRSDQIERLRLSGQASLEIRRAIERYNRGSFQLPEPKKRKRKVQNFQVFSLSFRPMDAAASHCYTSAEVRDILDAHWQHPDAEHRAALKREIAEQDKLIADLFAQYQAAPYIMEQQDDDD